MSKFYEELCDTFIRPSRQNYNIRDLGHEATNQFKRTDITIINQRNLKIEGSYFKKITQKQQESVCVVYLHSMNGSRLQSMPYVPAILKEVDKISFFSFDFTGSGNSGGQFVSLGYYEHLDLYDVIFYLHNQMKIKNFIIWGRSMGASTLLKFMELYPLLQKQTDSEIIGAILDSPFHSLQTLAIEIAQSRINLPEFLLKALMIPISSKIQEKAKFNIEQLQLLKYCSRIQFPILLLASKGDQLISCMHSEAIYKQTKSPNKQIYFIQGEHNQQRSFQALIKIFNFIKQCLSIIAPLKPSLSITLSKQVLSYPLHIIQNNNTKHTPFNLNNRLKSEKFIRHQRNVSMSTKNKFVREKEEAFNMGCHSIQKKIICSTQTINQHIIKQKIPLEQLKKINQSPQRKKTTLRSQSSLNHTPKIRFLKSPNQSSSNQQNIAGKVSQKNTEINSFKQDNKQYASDQQSQQKQCPQSYKIEQPQKQQNHFNVINQKLKLCKQNSKKKMQFKKGEKDKQIKSSKSIGAVILSPRKKRNKPRENGDKTLDIQKEKKLELISEQAPSLRNKNQLTRSKPLFQLFNSINEDYN